MTIAAAKSFEVIENIPLESIVLRKRGWGLTATQTSRKLDIAETMLKVLGTTLLFIASVLLLPVVWGLAHAEGFYQSEGLLHESLALFTIAASGMALRFFSLIGLRKQLQVDSKRGEIRVGYLQSGRRFREKICISHSDILSAFLIKSKCSTIPARLVFRLQNDQNAVVALKGPEAELKIILNQITDMASRRSHRKIRSRITNRLLHVRFDQ